MKYRRVGTSGLKISEISLGSWLTYGGTVENNIAKQCIATAIDNGVNFIDCAEIYARGGAERVLGEFFADGTYNRRNLVISTKVFWPTSDDVTDWGNSRKNIMNAINDSLKRLQMDYVDIYYLHRFDYTTPLEETIATIDDLIHDGKVHYWGTSVWTAAQLERANAIAREMGAHRPIVEQPMYNMLSRYIEMEIMDVVSHNGMGLTVWSPLAQGILTGKYLKGIPEESRAARSSSLKKRLTSEVHDKVKKLADIAESLEIKMSQLALAWILRRPEISAAITGATRPEHVIDNVAASDVTLSSATLDEIETILDNKPSLPDPYTPNIYYQDRMRY